MEGFERKANCGKREMGEGMNFMVTFTLPNGDEYYGEFTVAEREPFVHKIKFAEKILKKSFFTFAGRLWYTNVRINNNKTSSI